MIRILVFAGCCLLLVHSYGQELRSRVIVNADQIETTERAIFQEMEVALAEFLNNRKWTDDIYEPEERINCNFILNISGIPGIGRFEASVQVLSSRPIYNTDYETVLLNFADRDWAFEYVSSQPLQFNDNAFISNLTSILAYYAYIIIGLDYDSFEELGGEDYFQKAWQVVTNAQQTGFNGWDRFEGRGRNRYWLAENFLSNEMEPIRRAYYKYHRLGLDQLSEKPDDARKEILESVKMVQKSNNARPRSILTISFLDAKSEELAQVFTQGNIAERRNAYNILTEIDPTKSDIFGVMIE